MFKFILPSVVAVLLFSATAFGQRINGIVVDRSTGLAIPNAIVHKGYYTTLTSSSGDFSVYNVHFGDTIKISNLGYKSLNYVIGFRRPDTILVLLVPNAVMLNNVTINSKRNTKLDSLNARKEFANIFNYKAPTLTDAFLTVDPYEYRPDHFMTSEHTTAAIVGVDLLAIASLFGDTKTHNQNVREIALKDEEIRYVDTRFSPKKITTITGLQDKALRDFIVAYRPAIARIRAMTDYDLMVYIKNCYAKFAAGGMR